MAQRVPRQEPSDIPVLPDEVLVERAFRIRQIAKASDGKLRHIENVHIDRVQPDRGVDVERSHVLEEVKGLTKLKTITTIHRSVMPAYFMPSVKEVLAQIPPELLDQVTAYSIEYGKKNGHPKRINHDRAVTTLYTGKLPDHIAGQMVVLNGKLYKPPEPPPEPQDIPVLKPIRLKPRPPGM
jgi:hypothetical protein